MGRTYEELNGPWQPDEMDPNERMHSSGPRKYGRPRRRPDRNSNLCCQGITPEMETRGESAVPIRDLYADVHGAYSSRLAEGMRMIFASSYDE